MYISTLKKILLIEVIEPPSPPPPPPKKKKKINKIKKSNVHTGTWNQARTQGVVLGLNPPPLEFFLMCMSYVCYFLKNPPPFEIFFFFK